MAPLSPARLRELRAAAHHLNPVVSISGNGLSPSVLAEIDRALNAHELIKVRIYGEDRGARDGLMKTICEQAAAIPVQHIGKLLVLWREKAEDQARRTSAPPAAVPPSPCSRTLSGAFSHGTPGRPARAAPAAARSAS